MEKIVGPPQLSDFSKESVKKVVREKALGNAFTLYGIPLGLIGTAGFFLLDPTLISPIICLALMAGGFVSGLGATAVNFLRGDTIESKYIERLRAQMQDARRAVRDRVQADLEALGDRISGVEGVAEQGVEQMKLAKRKNDALQTLLTQKLEPSELTFGRFMGTAEQLYLSVLDNVRRIVDCLRSVESIDPARIKKRLREITQSKRPSDDDAKERVALEEQEKLRVAQIEDIHRLLRENEEVLMQLDATTAVIAKMETAQAREATVSLETAMDDMRRLAQRTKMQ